MPSGITSNLSGYVLVGGRSSRMGRNKAFLARGNRTLAETVAETMKQIAGHVTLIGDPSVYGHLGYPVAPDRFPEAGPMGGIATALGLSPAPWSLVVACDMPSLDAAILGLLSNAAQSGEADAVLPVGPSGRPEPLCAAYHRRSLPAFERTLAGGVRKITEAFDGLRILYLPVPDAAVFRNINTPEDWSGFLNG